MFRCQSSLLGTGGNGEQFERARRICSANAFISSRRTQRLRRRQFLQRFRGASSRPRDSIYAAARNAGTQAYTHAAQARADASPDTDASPDADASPDTAAGLGTAYRHQQWRRVHCRANALEYHVVQFDQAGVCALFPPVSALIGQ